MNTYEVKPCGPVRGITAAPGSKSITNRALLLAALAQGRSKLTGVLDSEDTRIMEDALRQLGLDLEYNESTGEIVLTGCGGIFPVKKGDLYVGNSGTTARFLTAALALSDGQYRIYGKQRMHERPIGDLIDALIQLGGDVRSENGNGCPPVLVRGQGKLYGSADVSANISSQFFSGVLMAAGASSEQVDLRLSGTPVSVTYLEMTLAVMRSFGVQVQTDEAFRSFVLPAGNGYKGIEYQIEPDASAASYLFALPAVCGGSKTVPGLNDHSLQGDVHFVDALAEMGCEVVYEEDRITVSRPVLEDGSLAPLYGIDIDMNTISDTVQTLAAVAVFAEGPTTISNVRHMRYKETDRIAAITAELRKLGAKVDEFDDGLRVWGSGGRGLHAAEIETYDDHRMAMSLALTGLAVPGIVIQNPECSKKTWPTFFDDLEKAVGRS